jgi:hypothetical protein
MDSLVDIDDPSFWPAEVVDTVEDAIERATEDNWREEPFECFSSAAFEGHEEMLRSLLSDYRLVGYHAARLLPHEVTDIRDVNGLQVLTDELRQTKVEEARSHFPKAFDGHESGAVLLASGPNAWQGTSEYRLGYIFFVAPFALFRADARGLMNLMDTWGGETLGWLNVEAAKPLSHALIVASEPAIVEFCPRIPTLGPKSLLPAFVGSLAVVPGKYWLSLDTTESVPAEYVLDVMTPASSRWPTSLDEYKDSDAQYRRPLS